MGIPKVGLMDEVVLGVSRFPIDDSWVLVTKLKIGLGGVEVDRESVTCVVGGVAHPKSLIEVIRLQLPTFHGRRI